MHFRIKPGFFHRHWIVYLDVRILVTFRYRNKNVTLKCAWTDGNHWEIHYDHTTFKGEITCNTVPLCTCEGRNPTGIIAAQWVWNFTDPAAGPSLSTRFDMHPWWTVECTTLDHRLIARTKMGCGWVRTIYRPSFHPLAPVIALDIIRQMIGDPSPSP